MNLWRVPIDERSGDLGGAFEPVTTPSTYSQHLSFARNGRRLAYVEVVRHLYLQRLMFDPDRELVATDAKKRLEEAGASIELA